MDSQQSGLFMKAFVCFYACQLFLSCTTAFANDSIGRVAAGGIHFQKSQDIRLLKEDLYISTSLIRVGYRFRNESDRNVHTTVVFPMPRYSWNPGELADDMNNRPLEDFSVRVDGQAITPQFDRRALAQDVDVTADLQDIGLSDTQIFKTFAECLDQDDYESFCGVSKQQEAALQKIGAWEVEETAYWQQDFPPRKTIKVQHEYPPFTGEYYDYVYQQGKFENDEFNGPDDACLDDGTRNALMRKARELVRQGAKTVRINVKEVEYILGTGRNWKGPISHFTLHIEKDSPHQIVSLCFPGKPRRISPTLLEFRQQDYIPQDKVIVYFFTF